MKHFAIILFIVFPLGMFSQEITFATDSTPAAANAEFPDEIVLPTELKLNEIEHFPFSTEKFDWDFIKQNEISISSFENSQPFVLEQPKIDLSFLDNLDKELKYLPHFDYQNNIFNRSRRDDLWANMYDGTVFKDKNFSI
ncbi:MAG: hypothetical protein LBN23_01470, partial [Paludibacter sp.]|nr:hypothetical protein [Paludibacter sp.]